ncbi:bacteriocin [Lactococcus lactis]|nr:bacteriocin [Lactococcus lactis]
MIKNFSSSSFKEVDSDKLQHITGGWAQYLIPVIVSGINHSDQIIKGWKKGFHRNHYFFRRQTGCSTHI